MKSIPRDILDRIILPNEMVTRSKPGLKLTKMPDDHEGNVRCSARRVFEKCRSGCDEFKNSKGVKIWENREENYDICIRCAQADRAIEMILNKEFAVFKKSIRQPY